MYGVLVFTLVLRSIYIVTWVYPWLRGLGYTSLGIFLLGFLLWNIDNIFCVSLRNFRKKVPPVIGVSTQFHAWWHLLTGLGSYLHILFSVYTRTLYLRWRPKVKFLFGIWPMILFEPLRKHWWIIPPRKQNKAKQSKPPTTGLAKWIRKSLKSYTFVTIAAKEWRSDRRSQPHSEWGMGLVGCLAHVFISFVLLFRTLTLRCLKRNRHDVYVC